MAKVKMFAPAGTTGCSFDGDAFEVDADGMVEVPEKAVETMTSHGFSTSRESVGKPFQAPTSEAMAELGSMLTAVKIEAEQLRGSVDAMKAERDAAQKRVAELEAELSKKRK